MSSTSRRHALRIGVFGAVCACVAPRVAFAADSPSGKFVCPPCGCSADGKEFDKAGDCPACGMPLMPKPAEAPKPASPPPKARQADDEGFTPVKAPRPPQRSTRRVT